jgi:alpha-beta hydrolase superfamily lysophospholipase
MTTDLPSETGDGRNIVLIHGLWLTPLSWEGWIQRFESGGHRVLAPAWPGMDGRSVEDLRQNTSAFERLGVSEITDHYASIIRDLDEPPIIIGHSFGGLITELLLDRGLGAAGVAVAPAPIKGVLVLPPAQLRSAWPGLRNPANTHKAVMLTPKQFRFAFANTLSEEEGARFYERHAIPGPGRVLFQAGLANFNPRAVTKVNLDNDQRAPLLLLGGGKDHTVPASTVRAAFRLQSKSKAVTEYKEYADRSHLTAAEPGWEEIADHALDWALSQSAEPAAVARGGAV